LRLFTGAFVDAAFFFDAGAFDAGAFFDAATGARGAVGGATGGGAVFSSRKSFHESRFTTTGAVVGVAARTCVGIGTPAAARAAACCSAVKTSRRAPVGPTAVVWQTERACGGSSARCSARRASARHAASASHAGQCGDTFAAAQAEATVSLSVFAGA
jgi:hypothetical protein